MDTLWIRIQAYTVWTYNTLRELSDSSNCTGLINHRHTRSTTFPFKKNSLKTGFLNRALSPPSGRGKKKGCTFQSHFTNTALIKGHFYLNRFALIPLKYVKTKKQKCQQIPSVIQSTNTYWAAYGSSPVLGLKIQWGSPGMQPHHRPAMWT